MLGAFALQFVFNFVASSFPFRLCVSCEPTFPTCWYRITACGIQGPAKLASPSLFHLLPTWGANAWEPRSGPLVISADGKPWCKHTAKASPFTGACGKVGGVVRSLHRNLYDTCTRSHGI